MLSRSIKTARATAVKARADSAAATVVPLCRLRRHRLLAQRSLVTTAALGQVRIYFPRSLLFAPLSCELDTMMHFGGFQSKGREECVRILSARGC